MTTKYKRISDGTMPSNEERIDGEFEEAIDTDSDIQPAYRFIVGDEVATYLVRMKKLSRHWKVTTAVLQSLLRDAFVQFGVRKIDLVGDPSPQNWGFNSEDELEDFIAREEDYIDYYATLDDFGYMSHGIVKHADFGVIWNSGRHVRYEFVTGITTIWRPFLNDPDMVPQDREGPTHNVQVFPKAPARGTPRQYREYLRWQPDEGVDACPLR